MHKRGSVLVLVVALAMVTVPMVAAVSAAPLEDATPREQSVTDATPISAVNASDAPPDPEEDVLGWENGYWHNESITVTRDDGLNDTELNAVVSRGMARVEYVRELEFDEKPPVEVISREEYKEDLEERYANMTESDRVHQNIKFEALFMIGENTDAISVQRSNRAGGTGGYYDPEAGEIKIISENVTTPKMNEITLSQELFHALQDRQFNISSFNQSTEELHNAKDGIIEGDGNLVDQLYQEECTEGIWNGSCLMPQEGGGSSDFDPHIGLYQMTYQPYSSGPPFVKGVYNEGGWEAVNDLYENPPASTEQVLHPDKYGEDEPVAVGFEDTSQDPWERQTLNGSDGNESAAYAQFGEGGLFIALWYPGYETQGQTTIIPYEAHLNITAAGDVSQTEPYLYEHPATEGWDGEKLVPYVTDDSAETNETAYVYKLAWDSASDAEEFRSKWLELMEFHGAEPVSGHGDTFRIPDGEEFGDAFYVTQADDTVVIVNAPTVEDLSLVYDGAAPEVETTPTDTATETVTETTTGEVTETETETESGPETPTETTGDSGPGFTLGLALVALAAGLLAATRRY